SRSFFRNSTAIRSPPPQRAIEGIRPHSCCPVNPAPLAPAGGAFCVQAPPSGVLDDRPVIEIDDLGIPDLPVEVVLKVAPVAEVGTAVAAMDGRFRRGVGRDIHLDRA